MDRLSIPHCREAQKKITLSFQNLEAALPPGLPAGRRSSSPYGPLIPELATIGSIPGGSGRSAWRDREISMQSEPRRPQIILSYIGGHVVKRAPNIAIPSCGPALTCMSTLSLVFCAPNQPSHPPGAADITGLTRHYYRQPSPSLPLIGSAPFSRTLPDLTVRLSS